MTELPFPTLGLAVVHADLNSYQHGMALRNAHSRCNPARYMLRQGETLGYSQSSEMKQSTKAYISLAAGALLGAAAGMVKLERDYPYEPEKAVVRTVGGKIVEDSWARDILYPLTRRDEIHKAMPRYLLWGAYGGACAGGVLALWFIRKKRSSPKGK